MNDGPVLIDGSPDGGRGLHPGPAASDIRLTLPAIPRNVVLVRHVVGEVAARQGLPEQLVEDVRLAVTEACTNVVRHAYAGETGELDVAVEPGDEALTVTVTDQGCGLHPTPAGKHGGLGLPLMAALANAVEFEAAGDRGSRVTMSFGRAQ